VVVGTGSRHNEHIQMKFVVLSQCHTRRHCPRKDGGNDAGFAAVMTAALLPSVRRQSIADGFRCQSSSINIDKYGKIRADVSFLFFGTQKIVCSLRLDSISLIDRKNLARFRSPCFSLANTLTLAIAFASGSI